MDVREKLVELLKANFYDEYEFEEIADILIAHGVTVQDNTEISDELLERLRKAPVTVMTEEPTVEVVNEWISVKDRLPEEDGNYLIFERGYLIPGIRVLSFAKDGRKVDKYDFHREWKNVWYRYDSEWGHLTIDNVTHWMPLPQPPKGE